MSEHVRTTRETVELLLRTVTEGTRDDLADLYAEVVGTLIPTGTRFELPSITVIRVVDGLIAESRDHNDAARTAKLFEELQAASATS